MDPTYITALAKLFRTRSEEVLSGEMRFSVSGQMLWALNDSFSLIVSERDTSTPPGKPSPDFVACPTRIADSSTFLDLQLIYDFIQILAHAQITQLVSDDELESPVDLSNFRNLRKLEIERLPVKKLRGLRRLRGGLVELTCQHCLSSCRDLLQFGGGDKTTGGFWTKLLSINFSYNALSQVDDSLQLAPGLTSLNLSHNRLTMTSLQPLKYLLELKYLDLSFNQLTAIPELSAEASSRLQTLRVRGNAIEDISEVANFEALVELDLSGNCLLFDLALMPISELASLCVLNLLGNPLAFSNKHRSTTINFLHSNTSTVKFILNGEPMTRAEKKETGRFPSYHVSRRPRLSSASTSSMRTSTTQSETSLGRVRDNNPMTDSARKRTKVREIFLSDDKDDEKKEDTEPIVVGSLHTTESSRVQIHLSEDHLETKKQIESLRNKFGSQWLNADGENIVKEMFPQTEEEENRVRRHLLSDELNNDSVLSSTPKEGHSSLNITGFNDLSGTTTTTLEHYGTADDRTTSSGDGTTLTAYESALSKDPDLTGLDFFQSQQSVDDDRPEPNEVIYKVKKLRSAKDGEENGFKCKVVVSDMSIKEKDATTNEVIHRWGLTVLESCERPGGNVISIQFNTMRSDKKQRFYLLEEEKECLRLTEYLRNVLANRNWDDLNQTVFRCANCTTQFCVDMRNQRAAERRMKCPECDSFYVIEITEQVTNKARPPLVQKVHSSIDIEDKDVIEKSNSHSSIGSAASLNESSSCSKISNPPASSINSNESVAGSSTSERDKDADLNSRRLGMESDVEILSNPSQSSIEVLNNGSKTSSRKNSRLEDRRNLPASFQFTLGESSSASIPSPMKNKNTPDEDECDDDAEQALDATSDVIVTNKLLNHSHLQTLTESSSSGSITESVCTQYEQQTSALAVEEHKPFVEVAVDEMNGSENGGHWATVKKSNSTFLEGILSASNVLKTLGNTSFKSQTADGIRLNKAEPFLFSATNFQQTDHRLHLYLHQNVFLESNEKFGSVIRMWYFDDAQKICQSLEEAILVLSNRMLYLFLVIGEEDDDPAQWLRLMRRVALKEWTGVQKLPFGMGVRFSFANSSSSLTADNWNLLLVDGQQTGNYLKVVTEVVGKTKVEESELREEHRRKLCDALKMNRKAEGMEKEGDDEDEMVLMVTPFKRLEKTANQHVQTLGRRAALVVTNKSFALLSANWRWLADGGSATETPEVLSQFAMGDMVGCEIKSETEFVLNFMDEERNQNVLWRIEFETRYTSQATLEAIKGPWEKKFKAPLIDETESG